MYQEAILEREEWSLPPLLSNFQELCVVKGQIIPAVCKYEKEQNLLGRGGYAWT